MRKLLFNVVLLIVFSFIPGTAKGSAVFSLSTTNVECSVLAKHLNDTLVADSLLFPPFLYSSYDTIDMLLNEASEHLGTRYVWGASGPKAFDCSGFTSYVFRQCGIEIPRTANAQATRGEKVDPDSMKPGDLIFFSSRRSGPRGIGHVGMVVERNDTTNEITFIHASCKRGVTYQKFPDHGYFSKKFICAKRLI